MSEERPADWMTKEFDRQLQPFHESGITRDLLDTVEPFFNRQGIYDRSYKPHCSRYTVRKGELTFRADLATFPEYVHRRFHIMTNVLTRLAPVLPDIDFELYLADGFTGWSEKCGAPIFAFSKHSELDTGALLLPDPLTIAESTRLRTEVVEGNTKYPWGSKLEKAFWRGSTTGDWLTVTDHDKNVRFKLVQLSAEPGGDIDALFTAFHARCQPELRALAERRGYLGSWTAISEHMQYKYLVLVDGFTSPWPRLFWASHSNSAILKQTSNIVGWFDSQMQPWVHYVPIAPDLSDLRKKIQWARDNDASVARMSQAARNFAAGSLTDGQIHAYIRGLLTSYGALFE